ncbi:hypothetical protein JXB02_04495 [Candidatus Woesearchaeota archaeon]|nr:hypothetical protein [Candidatus Woesearchaeota archaeon]
MASKAVGPCRDCRTYFAARFIQQEDGTVLCETCQRSRNHLVQPTVAYSDTRDFSIMPGVLVIVTILALTVFIVPVPAEWGGTALTGASVTNLTTTSENATAADAGETLTIYSFLTAKASDRTTDLHHGLK